MSTKFNVQGYVVTIEKTAKEDTDLGHDIWAIFVYHDVKEYWTYFRSKSECLRALIERPDRMLKDLELRPLAC